MGETLSEDARLALKALAECDCPDELEDTDRVATCQFGHREILAKHVRHARRALGDD